MSDPTTTAEYFRRTGEWILIGGLPVIAESIAWTVVLACFVALLIVQTRRKRPRGAPMIFIFSAMFALVSLVYACDLFWFFIQTRDIFLRAMSDEGKITPAERALKVLAQENVRTMRAVGNGSWLISLVKLLLGDSLVLWRAWELSSYNLAPKWMLVGPAAVLIAFTGTIPAVLVCRLQGAVAPREHFFAGVCGRKALVNWCLSLLSNLLSTCIIAYIGWRHGTEMRKLLHCSMRRRSIGEKILGLLAESGFFYFFVNIIFVITITSSSDTYSAGHVIARLFGQITACIGVLVPIATHVTVLMYGSLWDAMTEHNRVTMTMQFAGVGRVRSEASLGSPESVLHSNRDASKETHDNS